MTIPADKLDATVLALLFASEDALSARKLAGVVGDDVTTEDIHGSIGRITELLLENLPSIRLERVAGGYQLATNTDYAEYIARLYSGRRKQRLSRAAMETLAIIAYKQPITRADIEALRGVGCGGVLTTLMERSLIRIVGKAKVLGAPFLYGTTAEFLEYLGLNSLKDLPTMEELEELLAREVAAEAETEREAAEEETDGDDVSDPPGAKVEPYDMPGVKTPPEDEETSEETYEWEPPETEELTRTEATAETQADSAEARIDDKKE